MRVINRRSSIAAVLLFCSGAAALGYQTVWSRMFATGLGHETPSMLAIVCAFMLGIALGAALLDRVVDRSKTPGRWYAILEFAIGAWAFVSLALLPTANEWALRWIGVAPGALRHWAIAFAVPALVLLPATAAMGATFPAMERFLASVGTVRSVPIVYAANTFGAVAGIVLSTFAIAPKFGFTVTVALLGLLNFACAIAALSLSRGAQSTAAAPATPAAATTPIARSRLLLTLFITGLLGIGYEVVGTRVLAQVLENTIYTFAAVLSIYLLGTAAGAAGYHRWRTNAPFAVALSALLTATTVASILGVIALGHATTLYGFGRQVANGMAGAVVAEWFVASCVFLPATVLMGATFSHVVQALRTSGFGVGRAAALNTFGGAIAAVLFGVVLLPVLGSKWTLIVAALGYVALTPSWRRWNLAGLAVALLLVVAIPPTLHVVSIPKDGRLVAFREGVMATVAVVEERGGDRVLRVNNRFQMGGTAAADAQYRQAHLPLLLHPNPQRALFLGLGTGITLGGASLHTNVAIDGVELVPEIIELMPLFDVANRAPQRNPRITLHTADARRFIRATTNRYDVIVADLFHPARDGAGALYTLEHFDAIRQRLALDGLFCQWLPLHQLDGEMFATITRTFTTVFPDARIFLLRFNVDVPVVGLVGTYSRFNYGPDWLESRVGAPELQRELKRLALTDSLRLLGHFVANGSALVSADSGTAINTDDDPVVTFRAPRFAYAGEPNPYGRLTNLLAAAARVESNDPPLTTQPAFQSELRAYGQARDRYIAGLVSDREGDRDAALESFLVSAQLSPDFTPGYAQCLAIAGSLAKTDPPRARAILERLMAAQPARPVAAEMLKRLAQ